MRDGVSVETGGFVDTANQRLAVAHAPVVKSAADLAGLIVTRRVGAPLRVGDVATVVRGPPGADRRRHHQRRARACC